MISRALGAGIAAAVVLLPAARSVAAPRLADLTPAARERLDRLARLRPPQAPGDKAVSLAGDFTAWLIARSPLPPEDERDHARQLHQELVSNFRTAPTPPAAERVFRRLLDPLPPHLKPEAFRYTLVVLDVPEVEAFTAGGGQVYVSRPLLDGLLSCQRGEAALAFVLAHELGHVGLGHTARGWQMVEVEDDIRNGVLPWIAPESMRAALGTAVRRTGRVIDFLYTHDQQREADLFSLHLCRNAGFAIDEALDALRWLAAEEPVGPARPGVAGQSDFLASPAPLDRLRTLLMERDGDVEDEEKFGLFAYDPRDDSLAKCASGSVQSGDRPVILVHGLHGQEPSFRPGLPYLAGRAGSARDRSLTGRRLLLFRYPNNESLARCGHFLHREMARVVKKPAEAVFIAHSAGGLVVRWYAEILGGGLDRAVFLATPHAGSSLTDLKVWLDLGEFAGGLRAGIRGRLAEMVREGGGAVVQDLHPDSLFLRRLGNDPARAARYHVFAGRCLSWTEEVALRYAVGSTREALIRKVETHVQSPALRGRALRWLDRLRLPPEWTDGDFVVSVESAALCGAGRITRVRLHHRAFLTDDKVRRQVIDSVLAR